MFNLVYVVDDITMVGMLIYLALVAQCWYTCLITNLSVFRRSSAIIALVRFSIWMLSST